MTSRQRKGRPPKISRDEVLAAALAIADKDGLSAVTIRGVATRMGVAPMTLYSHVASAEELVDMVVSSSIADAVAEALADPVVRQANGRQALVTFARGLRDLLREHPAVLEAYRRGPIQDRTGLAVTDYVLAALTDDGLSHDHATEAYAAVYAYVVGFVQLEARPTTADPSTMHDHPAVAQSPRLATMYDRTTFERGLGALVDGLVSPDRP